MIKTENETDKEKETTIKTENETEKRTDRQKERERERERESKTERERQKIERERIMKDMYIHLLTGLLLVLCPTLVAELLKDFTLKLSCTLSASPTRFKDDFLSDIPKVTDFMLSSVRRLFPSFPMIFFTRFINPFPFT